MLRITQSVDERSVATLRLEGKLLGLWVEELARSCDELFRWSARVRLDLSSVTFVDDAGLALLQDLLGRGVALAGCSRLIAELLQPEAAR